MSQYSATVEWQRDGVAFVDNRYSRRHRWTFDGGIVVPASASPSIVPLPMSSADAVDPEEAFVASIASCHMLWFLSIAAESGFVVESYSDRASGRMARNSERHLAITEVVLKPKVTCSGARQPSRDELREMHEAAHAECFIANSVRTEIRCEPQ